MPVITGILGITAALLSAGTASAAEFSDVQAGTALHAAVTELRSRGVVQGYDDGTFRPNQQVNRAEAVKMIVAPLLEEKEILAVDRSAYDDVPGGVWFLPFVEYARGTLGIIDSPPKQKQFRPADSVLEAEFFKILLLAYGEDVQGSYAEIRSPLAVDVTSADEWYYPYMRLALAHSLLISDTEGNKLNPGKTLTRGDVAIFVFRYLMHRDGRRTQALLSAAEQEIIVVLNNLEKNLNEAQYASHRSLLHARGAHSERPDESIVQGALKISEAFVALVDAYELGVRAQYDGATEKAGEAWNLAQRATELSTDLQSLGDQVKEIAHSMADSAREKKAEKE